MRALRPECRVWGAEPETAAPLAASLAAGAPVRFDAWQPSFVDGAGGRNLLPTMWPFLRDLDGAIVVPLADVQAAMRMVAEQLHVIAEGAGAMAVAAALSGQAGDGTVVAVVSGGNIDLSRFAKLVDDDCAQPRAAQPSVDAGAPAAH
jgi:threonine dehydratase